MKITVTHEGKSRSWDFTINSIKNHSAEAESGGGANRNNMKNDKLLLAGGILAGAAAGVLLGVLLAPDKGSATRRKIMEKGEDYIDDLKEKLDDFVAEVNEKVNAVKNNLASYTNDAKCSCKGECTCGLRKNEESAQTA